MAKGVVLDVALARELASSDAGAELDGWVVVSNEEDGGHGRWVSYHQLVISNESGESFAATYEQGLTEMQETKPWEYDDTVTFTEVVPMAQTVEVTTYAAA